MKKYNSIVNHMNFALMLINMISPVMIVFFATQKQSIDTIVPMIGFMFIIVTLNFVYFYLLDHWYLTYYDENKIIQKWLKKRKRIDFNKVQYMYFIDNLVILSEKQYNVPTQNIKIATKRKIKRTLKNEICIVINVYDKIFPKILLSKCNNAIKINLDVKENIYREMFELDTATGLE